VSRGLDPNEGYIPSRVPREWYENALDLKARAELVEVIEVLVDAMRRSDPLYCAAHQVPPCCDEDWDTAIEAGEDAIEANR
jgi:hypothetical protein